MKKIFLLAILVIVAYTEIIGQIVSGKITDAHTKESLPGVNIYFPEIKKGVVTDLDGNYQINVLRTGEHKIQVSFVGYEIVLKNIDVQKEVTLNIVLHPAVIESKEFVLSSVYHSSQDENPVDVVQVDSKKLTQSSSPSLMQQLTTVPGVNLISSGTSIGKPVIRGLSYNRVLVYSDGVGLDNQQFGDEHGLGLSEIGIDKVEIIKGPSSLYYGADAMGGVLHFISERPALVNTVVGDFTTKYFSNTNGNLSSIGVKGATEHIRYRIRGGFSSHGDYQQGNGMRVTNTRYSESALKAGVGFVSKWWTNDINMSLLQTKVGIYEELGEQNINRTLNSPFQFINDYLVSSQNTFYIKKSHINFTFGIAENSRKEYEEGKLFPMLVNQYNRPSALNMRLKTYSYDIKFHLPEHKHIELIFGSQGKMQTNRNFGEENLIPDANEQQSGAFVMTKISTKKLTTIAGLRYDVKQIKGMMMGNFGEEGYKRAFKQFYDSYNGSLGVTYQANEKFLIRTNFASGFRSPNLAEIASNGAHEGTFRYEIGNLKLHTEQNFELDLGFEYNNEHVSLIWSGFQNQINNYIYLSPKDSLVEEMPVFTYEQTDAVLRGLETTIDVHPHAMHWLHFETNFAMVIASKSNGEPLPRIPAFNLNNIIKVELKDWKNISSPFFSISANTLFAQNRVDNDELQTPAYFLLEAKFGASIQWNKFLAELTFGVSNVMNQRYYNHLSRLKPEGIYDMGRNFFVSLKIPFSLNTRG